MAALPYRASAFGMLWHADLPLPGFDDFRPGARPPLGKVEVCRTSRLPRRSPLRTINRGHVYSDGIRFAWKGEIVFDMFEGTRVDYRPGANWSGSLPVSFYSTVAALTLAWRGLVPVHASTVEIDGRAFLIAGPSGAGKSSLAAGLIALGAALVSDDLTVIRVGADGSSDVLPGRPTMRQHAETAAALFAGAHKSIASDGSEKWLVRPSSRTSQTSLPLGGILLLSNGFDSDASGNLVLLASSLFRPRWMASLPNHASLRKHLLTVASTVPMRKFPPIGRMGRAIPMERAEGAMAALGEMTG